MYSSGSSTPDLGYYKLPPIITTEADREFLNEVNAFIDSELEKINHLDEEQRYLVYKTVFNKVIEHVTAYKPVLVQIKKEYEDTIDTIKKGQREATFLQEKLKAMASEPSTLRNYRKRGDELEERIAILKKKNEQIQQELQQIKLVKEEKEKRPKTAEKPERELKKDSRLIPGLSIEEATDMKVLQKKYETLDRQLKELSLSLRARFLPKTHKLQLKESLDNKVAYRDQLLWQSQVYKARGQKLKIALEAAQAYNQMKPPHQTVGDAVTIAFQHAMGMMRAEKEKTEGEQADTAQASTFEDDDPNKEKEAEMMLEYIEKFNELFEDGLFEEAAVHAANSPKGILRTQATLAKFRDVKVKTKGRSPLLAFCDSIMSSVKAAGSRPNEALSMDCMQACLNENRLDLAYHWLSQDRLTQSVGLGKIISEHCSCPLPCKCGCQALAQSVFMRQKCHLDVVITMLKQGKSQGAMQYVRQRQCINDENVSTILSHICNMNIVTGLLEKGSNGKKCLPDLNFGSVLQALVDLEKIEMTSNLIQTMLKPPPLDADANTSLLSLENAVMQDTTTSPEQWMSLLDTLHIAGFQDSMYQLLAMTFVVNVIQEAWSAEQENNKKGGVSFSEDIIEAKDITSSDEDQDSDDDGKVDDDAKESSVALSSRSREDTNTSMDHSSRETSPDIAKRRGQMATKESILKKKHRERDVEHDPSSSECSPRKSPPARKRVVKMSRKKVGITQAAEQSDDDECDSNSGKSDDKSKEKNTRRKVRMNITPNKSDTKNTGDEKGSRVRFGGDEMESPDHGDDKRDDSKTESKAEGIENRVSFNIQENENEPQDTVVERKKSGVRFEMSSGEEGMQEKLEEEKAAEGNSNATKLDENENSGVKADVQVDGETTDESVAVVNLTESQDIIHRDDEKEKDGGEDNVEASNFSKVRYTDENENGNDIDDKKEEDRRDGNKDDSSSRVKFVDDRVADQVNDRNTDDNDEEVKENKSQRVGFVEDGSKYNNKEEDQMIDNPDISNSPKVRFIDDCMGDKNDNEDNIDMASGTACDGTKQALIETTEACKQEDDRTVDGDQEKTVDESN